MRAAACTRPSLRGRLQRSRPGRSTPPPPVALGLGIAVYFTADRVDGFCFGLRCDGGSCPDAPACHCISSCTWARCNGPRLAVSTLRTARIAHRYLQRPYRARCLLDLSRSARRESGATASDFASSVSRRQLLSRRQSASALPSARAVRRRWGFPWSSRLICRRRHSLCVPVDTTSRVTCISSASAPQATHSVQSTRRRRQSSAASG